MVVVNIFLILLNIGCIMLQIYTKSYMIMPLNIGAVIGAVIFLFIVLAKDY